LQSAKDCDKVGDGCASNRIGGTKMAVLRMVLTIIFILICIALSVLVLLQEGKTAGLGSISGAAETYWGKNKGRSMEGTLVKITKYLAIGFMLLALVLNLNVF
jgi:preprotein translocase subunit SecG